MVVRNAYKTVPRSPTTRFGTLLFEGESSGLVGLVLRPPLSFGSAVLRLQTGWQYTSPG